MNHQHVSTPKEISVAPMLDWTDRHCRYFHRLLTQKAVLYTEMVTVNAVLHGSRDFLYFTEAEQPVVLQLGGSNPKELAEAVKKAQDYPYHEINLNVGCPSDRVQQGRFGACLMAEPKLVADCILAMQDAAGDTPITVKTRLGIDHQDSYEFLTSFVDAMVQAQSHKLILHARKAWLKGLSPKENRTIPDLNYERVYQIKQDYPQLTIHLNGGIETPQAIAEHLVGLDGVMVGRAAYHNPYLLTECDALLGLESQGELLVKPKPTRHEVVMAMAEYITQEQQHGVRPWQVIRHILGLYHGVPGAKVWKRHLSEFGPKANSAQVLMDALAQLEHQSHDDVDSVSDVDNKNENHRKIT